MRIGIMQKYIPKCILFFQVCSPADASNVARLSSAGSAVGFTI
jgi:hypothetical protein